MGGRGRRELNDPRVISFTLSKWHFSDERERRSAAEKGTNGVSGFASVSVVPRWQVVHCRSAVSVRATVSAWPATHCLAVWQVRSLKNEPLTMVGATDWNSFAVHRVSAVHARSVVAVGAWL